MGVWQAGVRVGVWQAGVREGRGGDESRRRVGSNSDGMGRGARPLLTGMCWRGAPPP